MKKIIIITIIAILLTIIIYNITKTTKINLLVLGDSMCSGETKNRVIGKSYNDYLKNYYQSQNKLDKINNDFCNSTISLEDLINNISKNVKKNKHTLQYLIKKANLITISVGNDELSNLKKITNEAQKKYFVNYKQLIKMLKKYTKQPIIIIGPNPRIGNRYPTIDLKLNQLCKNNSIIYISQKEFISRYNLYYDSKSPIINEVGHYIIYKKILSEINQ